MDTTQQQDANDAGCPQRDQREDSTAEAADASRVVTREQTGRTPQDREQVDSFEPVGEEIHARPGRKGIAVPIYVPRPCAAASAQAAIIDWLAFTIRLSDHYHMAQLLADIQRFFNVSRTADCDYGWNGYTRRTMLGEFGMVAWGGKSQNDTAYVSLNAHGCAMATDWAGIEEWIAGLQAKISRIDLAHDDFTGEEWNIERLRAEYLGDGFSGTNGRKPSSMLIGDYDNLDKPIVSFDDEAWQKGLSAAGIKNFRWHDLRHTWASWLAQEGTLLHVLQVMGGWASYDMVLKYAHLSPERFATHASVVDRKLDGTNPAQPATCRTTEALEAL